MSEPDAEREQDLVLPLVVSLQSRVGDVQQTSSQIVGRVPFVEGEAAAERRSGTEPAGEVDGALVGVLQAEPPIEIQIYVPRQSLLVPDQSEDAVGLSAVRRLLTGAGAGAAVVIALNEQVRNDLPVAETTGRVQVDTEAKAMGAAVIFTAQKDDRLARKPLDIDLRPLSMSSQERQPNGQNRHPKRHEGVIPGTFRFELPIRSARLLGKSRKPVSAKLPVVVIVGRPNVGKSTLFNRFIRRRVAVVEDTPGVTRDRLYAETEWRGKKFTVVDTGGILFSDEDPLIEQIRIQAEVAIAEADVVLFMADATSGLTPDDRDLAQQLRGLRKPLFIVVNKSDNPHRDQVAGEFYELGLGDVWPVSGLHGRGVADLLDEVVALLPDFEEKEDHREEIKLAIIGRPNVGKSSLLNAFTGEVRSIVSEIPGTTRDAIDTMIEFKNERFRLIDTAGIRRKGKIQGTVEYYMVNRATRALERAECALVVVNGVEGLTDGDKRIAKLAHDAGKACVFAINKWDLKDPEDKMVNTKSPLKKAFIQTLRDEIPELAYAPIVFTSAKEALGLEPALKTVLTSLENYAFRISTGALNRLIQDAMFRRPYSSKGRAFKVYYATQVSTTPPTFVLFCNDPDLMHFSYERYIENQIRKAHPLPGTPIRLFARSSHERKS